MSRSLLRRIAARSPGELALLAEALVMVSASAAMLAIVPFRHIVPKTRGAPADPADARKQVRAGAIGWAVAAVARRVPWRAMCFEQGLAAYWMLRRRRLPALLHYGVRARAEALDAHVWVSSAGHPVTGFETRALFDEIAVFPPQSPAR